MPTALFVCTGNICRSAFAMVLARKLETGTWNYTSAGIAALVGHGMDPPTARQAAARGIDVEGYSATQLTGKAIADVDLVLCMDRRQRMWVLEERPGSLPKTFGLAQFARAVDANPTVYGLELIGAAHALRDPMMDSDEIADPYRRGDTAAEATADRIEGMVSRVVAALEGSATGQ